MGIRRNRNGFTLAELLIVVAIIGVLVAISIPIFSDQLEKAREATDAANIRSQYAQVLADALFDGGSVNGKIAYGAVPLRQKTDGWQTAGIDTNLHGVFSEVTGSPVVGGSAWVEYDGAQDKTILHYEGSAGNTTGGGEGAGTGAGSTTGGTGTETGAGPAGGSTGGGAGAAGSSTAGGAGGSSSSSTGGSTTGGSGATGGSTTGETGTAGGSTGGSTGSEAGTGGSSSNKINALDKADVPSLPSSQTSTPIKIYRGERYLYNGELYIVNADKEYYPNYDMPSDSNKWLFVKPSGILLSPSDAPNNVLQNLNIGDIYVDKDGISYIRLSNSSHGVVPKSDPGNWCEIKS